MKKKTLIIESIILSILLFSLLTLHLVLAEPASRGVTGGIPSGTTSTAPLQQPSSCLNPQQCREIDEVWQRIGMSVRNSGKIWDNSARPLGWKEFTAVYVPPVPLLPTPIPIPSPTVTATELQGCPITTSSLDSQAVGTLRDGSLINGVKTATTSFTNFANEAYSYDTQQMEKMEYGTVELIQALELTSCVLKEQFGVKLQVKDRSLPTGGPTYKNVQKAQEKPPQQWVQLEAKDDRYRYTRHSTHLNGRDADIGYFVLGSNGLVNKLFNEGCGEKTCSDTKLPTDKFKDQGALEANWILLKTLNQIFPLEYVAFDQYLIRELHRYVCSQHPQDPDLAYFFRNCNIPDDSTFLDFYSPPRVLRHVPGHADHFHITIKCPRGDTLCTGGSAGRGVVAPSQLQPVVQSSLPLIRT